MTTKNCSGCGKFFKCGNSGLCWCSEFPSIMPLDSESECLCSDCLKNALNTNIDEFIISRPLKEVLKIAAQYKSNELIENIDYSVEDDKWIFTKWFLLKRGFCCDNGCRNCPYRDK